MFDALPLLQYYTREEVEEIMDEFYDIGYTKRRRTIAKAVQSHDLPRATLENQPDDLTKLDDGTQFLQLKLPGLYVYYSRKTIQKAVENGLVALVADGIHKLPPEELGKDGQLYTIHGVCNGGIGKSP
ncbi:unnamed protein product [Cylicocyclus nassatus]|uniref:Uncharacterized protein n=1 Tax=Cylicocyclus nassatus TaxID=53992 RepID=A0AA36GTK6_CYLNA|nr:unnamed protein product [Cylicocyclus nassatus]